MVSEMFGIKNKGRYLFFTGTSCEVDPKTGGITLKYYQKLKSDEYKVSRLLELLFIFLAFSFLSGCSKEETLLPVPQEMGNMALLRTFAADVGEDVPWKVTVSTGKQAKGLQGEQEPPLVLSGESASLIGACRQLEGLTDHTIFYGYIDQLLLGMDVGNTGISHVLEYFTTQPALSLGTGIWLSSSTGEELIVATAEEGTQEYLGTMISESKLGNLGLTRKIGEVLTDIREINATYIPILGVNPQGGLEEEGYALFRGDTFVTTLKDQEAMGLNLLLGQDQLLELQQNQGIYAVNLNQISTSYQGEWSDEDDQKLKSVEIHLEIRGKLLEYSHRPEEEALKILRMQGEEEVAKLCQSTLAVLQKYQVDVLYLSGHLGLSHPLQWTWLENNWEDVFSQVEMTVIPHITLTIS